MIFIDPRHLLTGIRNIEEGLYWLAAKIEYDKKI